jgi:hypothetical protein
MYMRNSTRLQIEWDEKVCGGVKRDRSVEWKKESHPKKIFVCG